MAKVDAKMSGHYPNLNAEKALIWRIVHRDNVDWILRNGVHCATSNIQDPDYVAIGNAELINRRARRQVPVEPGGTLADYVPFYFTPFSPMMYNIYTGRGEVRKRSNEEICILVSSIPRVQKMRIPFVFTDRHAYPPLARYFNDEDCLDEIDWPLIQARNFQRNPDDPEQIERYQAEALIHRHLPVSALRGIICYTDKVKNVLDKKLDNLEIELDVLVKRAWYF